jgi:mannose-6-phosphate isomerase-like protein (cupin superfamily)
MSNTFYTGSYRKDGLEGPNRGWILGEFMADTPRKNSAVEIKYWEFTKDEAINHIAKVSSIIECTLILKGSVKGLIDGKEVTLKEGDYFVVEPGVPNNVPTEVIENCAGLTVKAPSDPTAKKPV